MCIKDFYAHCQDLTFYYEKVCLKITQEIFTNKLCDSFPDFLPFIYYYQVMHLIETTKCNSLHPNHKGYPPEKVCIIF